jgi:hypothetical protein
MIFVRVLGEIDVRNGRRDSIVYGRFLELKKSRLGGPGLIGQWVGAGGLSIQCFDHTGFNIFYL